jgi:uncharacterized protein
VTPPKPQTLTLVDGTLAICRLAPKAELPLWANASAFLSVTRTPEELSVVCPETRVPDGTQAERGWRALKLEGPFDLSLTGILASVLDPLADANIGIFALSTYDTDYVLVEQDRVDEAARVLVDYGHEVRLTDDKLTSAK